MFVPRVCFLVALTLASIKFDSVDATLVDLLNNVKNQLKALQKGQEEVKAGQKTIQNEVEEVQEEVQAMNNTIKVDDIKEKVHDINVKVDAILHHVSETDGNRTPGSTTEQATTLKPTLEPGPRTTKKQATTIKPTLEPVPMKVADRGTAGASSTYDDRFPANNAFTNSGRWEGAINQFPALVWMHYQNSHTLTKIGIRNHHLYYTPRKFQVVASNDCRSWTTLLSIDDAGFTESGQFKTWIIPKNSGSFSCFGLRFPDSLHSNVAVEEIIMWE